MADAGTPSQQMPRQDDDLIRRVKVLEQLMQQTQSAAAGAQAVGSQLSALIAQQNALLSNQVTADSKHNETNGFGLTTTPTEILRVTFTVPSGYTRALILAAASCGARNNNSGISLPVQGYADINGGSSTTAVYQSVQPFDHGSIFPTTAATLTGLASGSTFYARIVAYITPTGSFAADSTNRATVDASVVYLK